MLKYTPNPPVLFSQRQQPTLAQAAIYLQTAIESAYKVIFGYNLVFWVAFAGENSV
jgi:hypothetical protein